MKDVIGLEIPDDVCRPAGQPPMRTMAYPDFLDIVHQLRHYTRLVSNTKDQGDAILLHNLIEGLYEDIDAVIRDYRLGYLTFTGIKKGEVSPVNG